MSSQSAVSIEAVPIADVQASADARNIAIDQVGIKDIRYPVRVADRSGVQNTVASVNMYVALPPGCKGTHMSRFVDVLHGNRGDLCVNSFNDLLAELGKRLDAPQGRIELTFPYFITKHAPVSGASSMMDYEITLVGEIDHERRETTLKVVIPVTSLCPCSKEISEYGAHNQRSHVTVEVRPCQSNPSSLSLEELIEIVESQASSELYGLLKRADEKFITEKAYDNPKFVEDVVRDVAGIFNADQRIIWYSVSVENFESIHNHSAYARISRDKSG